MQSLLTLVTRAFFGSLGTSAEKEMNLKKYFIVLSLEAFKQQLYHQLSQTYQIGTLQSSYQMQVAQKFQTDFQHELGTCILVQELVCQACNLSL